MDGAYVLVPAGKTVRLDSSTAFLAGVRLEGALVFDDNGPRKLVSRFVLVKDGLLQIGTEVAPFRNKAIITLTGTDETVNVIGEGNMAMGTKFLGTFMGAGRLELHGARRDALSWSQLDGSVQPGATSITLKDDASSWRVGDEIVIAPSGFEPLEAEQVRITSVKGTTVSFTPALKHAHFGQLQSYNGSVLDERAEVGLLTRDIVVQGANDSDASAFGGHTMAMGASARIEGVEFRNMGQRGHKGRYSFHWHFAGDRPDDYFKNNSVHRAYQRAVVVHQTNDVLVQNNVAFDVTNHMYVNAEDGVEKRTRFIGNLGILTRSPERRDFAFPTDGDDFFLGHTTQGEFRSSTFWGRSFEHTMRGNHAAGVIDGNGFFFDPFNSLGGAPTDQGPFVFEDNVVHGVIRRDARGLEAETYPEATFGHGIMFGEGLGYPEGIGPKERVVLRTTAYKNFGGFWLEDRASVARDSIAADNGAGVFVLRGVLDGVTIVGQSANRIGEPPLAGGHGVRAAIVAPPSHGGERAPVILDATVIDQADTALHYNRHELGDGARVEKLTLVNTPRPLRMITNPFFEYRFDELYMKDPRGQILKDGADTHWVHVRSPNLTQACSWQARFNAAACPAKDQLKLTVLSVQRDSPRPIVLVTEQGRALGFTDPLGVDQQSVSLRTDTRYRVAWLENRPAAALEFELEDSGLKVLQLVFAASGAPTRLVQNGITVGAANSLSALESSTSGYFFDSANRRLHLRLQGGTGKQRVSIVAPFTGDFVGRPADALTSLQPGLRFGVLEGDRFGPLLDTSGNPVKTGISSGLDLSVMNRSSKVSVIFEGYLNVPETGLYQIGSRAQGDANVFIGGALVATEVRGTDENSYEINGLGLALLERGLHPLKVVYSHHSSTTTAPGLKLFWKRSPTPDGGFEVNEIPASAYRQ
jgi:hypothetical protein